MLNFSFYLRRFVFILKNRPKSFIPLLWNYFYPIVSEETFVKVRFRLHMGYWMDMNNPKTYNEKLQWLKLHARNPEYTKMVDKVEAKKFVSSIIGDKYIIPTLGVWNSVDEIDWDSLPNQFVVKATGDSGGVVVCKDKTHFQKSEAITKLKALGARNYNKSSGEYPYEHVPHRFIAEQYMEDESGYELKDYKIFCFDGVPKILFVATGRQIDDTRFDFFDTSFRHLPIKNGHENADITPTKPENFEEMLDIASKLSVGIPHVRVDLYNIKGNIFFGEMTFFHWSGIVPFEPKEWDVKMGEWLTLPLEK